MTITRTIHATRIGFAGVLAASALALSACGGSEPTAAASATTSGTSAASATTSDHGTASASGPASESAASAGPQASALTVVDPWTKATDGAMTGSFGTLRNDSDAPLHVVSVSSEAAPRAELHEMADTGGGQKVMRQTADGLTVPAHGSLELVPGGHHVMLMDLADPVEPGEEVAYVLTLEDGSTLEVRSVARPFTGANESYHGGEASSEHGMGHGATSSASGSVGHGDH